MKRADTYITDTGVQLQAACAVDIGMVRSSNQDETVFLPQEGFFGVTDGMGGLNCGEAAAAYVQKSMTKLIHAANALHRCEEGELEDAKKKLLYDVQIMSDKLYQAGNTQTVSYGATVSGVWIFRNKALFVNLGDSRGYMLKRRRRTLTQITEDHNLAAVFVRAGELSRTEAVHHYSSSRLTAFVGMTPHAKPEVFEADIEPGDRILLCSDGLYSMVSEPCMVRLMRSSKSQQTVCDRLIERANQNGGRDNISVVCIRIG